MRAAYTTFAFRIPPELLTRLRQVAAREGSNAGELIRRALLVELDRLAVQRIARELDREAS